jgi:transcriptional regulator with XRE-family HTH domain
MDADDRQTTGQRLRRIRHARRKSLEVVAGLAGISASFLSRLERGERALDRHSLIVALAKALEIAPSELLEAPLPVPPDERIGAAVRAVRAALLAVAHHAPDGEVLPVEVLRTRVTTTVAAHCRCDRDDEVGAALPALIRDLHTSIAAGRHVAELLDLAVLLHTEATTGWLRVAGAPLDLRSQAVVLGRQAAENRGTATALGLAVWGGVHLLVAAGAFDLAEAELDSTTVPTTSPPSTQLAGMLALCRSLVAAAANRADDVAAPLDAAADIAAHTGEGNAYWMGFGPTNVGCWRMHVALETGDHDRAVDIAESVHPQLHPHRGSQALYWVDYGRALSRVRGRRHDAAKALRRAEQISPPYLHRDPSARETLAELVGRSKQDDAVDRELRRMAYRAGLPA